MGPVKEIVLVVGSYSSQLATAMPPLEAPPAMRTLPLASRVAECQYRATVMLGPMVNTLVAGSNSSVLCTPSFKLRLTDCPPMMITFPDPNSVAV